MVGAGSLTETSVDSVTEPGSEKEPEEVGSGLFFLNKWDRVS